MVSLTSHEWKTRRIGKTKTGAALVDCEKSVDENIKIWYHNKY